LARYCHPGLGGRVQQLGGDPEELGQQVDHDLVDQVGPFERILGPHLDRPSVDHDSTALTGQRFLTPAEADEGTRWHFFHPELDLSEPRGELLVGSAANQSLDLLDRVEDEVVEPLGSVAAAYGRRLAIRPGPQAVARARAGARPNSTARQSGAGPGGAGTVRL